MPTATSIAMRAAAALILAAAAPARSQPVDCAAPACAAKLSPACLKRVGAGALAARDACRAEQDAYLRCVTAVAETCGTSGTGANAAACAPEDARILWADLKDSDDVDALDAFAADCAGTPFARQAALRALGLRQAAAPDRPKPTRLRSRDQVVGAWVFDQKTGVGACQERIDIPRAGDGASVLYGKRYSKRIELVEDGVRLKNSDGSGGGLSGEGILYRLYPDGRLRADFLMMSCAYRRE